MALIDKETIRTEIERRTYNAHEMPDSRPDKQFYEGKDVAYGEILAFLDTLQEQPKLKPMNIPSAGGGMSTNPPSYKLDVKPEQPELKPHTQSGIPPLDYYQGIMAGRSDVIDHPEQYGLQKTIKLDEKDMEMYQEVMTAIIFAKNRLKELGCEGLSERMTSAFEWLKTKFKSK